MGNENSSEEEDVSPGSLTGLLIQSPDIDNKPVVKVTFRNAAILEIGKFGTVQLISKEFIKHVPYIGDMYSYYLIHCVDDKKTDIRGYFLPPIQDKRLLNWYKQKDFTYAIQKITMDILEIFLVFHSERSSLLDEESEQPIISEPSTIGPFIGSQSPPHIKAYGYSPPSVPPENNKNGEQVIPVKGSDGAFYLVVKSDE